MKSDRKSGMNPRQKITVGVFLVVLIIIIWQVWGLFSGGGSSAPAVAPAKPGAMAGAPGTPGAMNARPQMQTPQPVQLAQKPEPLSPREIELMKVQQETQAKYVAALNELQMLKISRDIAETNQAIVAAKLATVTAQKGIVDLLTPKPVPAPPPPASYGAALANPTGQLPTPPASLTPPPAPEVEVSYTVVSVSLLQYKWSAVVGNAGNLYNVSVGDFLPPDRSKVVSISKAGVVLEKNGVRKKISLVPII